MKNNIALVGASFTDQMRSKLSEHGYSVFTLKPNSRISPPVASHPDLSLFIIKNTLFIPRNVYSENAEVVGEILKRASLDLMITETSPHAPYPSEAAFCAVNINDRTVIANKKILAKEIISFCDRENITIAHTSQGYARCTSICFNNCLASADPSMLKAAESIGLRTLKISQGSVDLPPYSYGFIGGSCGFDGKKIYFCGDISLHPNYQQLLAFFKENNAEPVSLTPAKLYDVGSIFFI